MATPGHPDSVSRRRLVLAAGLAALCPAVGFADKVNANRPGEPPKLAVCLGSGGLHGFAHIGVIRAFERLGVRPDIICGTSVGAVVGVLWAAGFSANDIEAIAKEREWYELSWFRIPKLGFGTLDELRDALNQHIGEQRVESLPVRFAAVATDLETGRPVILDRGEPGRVAAASASVPLRYEPVMIAGRKLVDGVLTAPVPVEAARALGADFCLAIDIAYRPDDEPVTGLSDVAYQAFHILINRLIDEQIRRADFAFRLDAHQFMRGDGGLQNLVQQAEKSVYRRCADLISALSQAGITLSANDGGEGCEMR
jgi:NTE family protein